MTIIPVILCGGSGSRLWPISRETHPKLFIRLPDGRSMLQNAFLRSLALPGLTEIYAVTNQEFLFKIEEEVEEIGAHNTALTYILEPFGRNTAAAVASAALNALATHGEDAVLLALAADHYIRDAQAFNKAVGEASALACQGKLVVFGVTPDSPETGYGYIEVDAKGVVQRFVEKPSQEKAREYVSSGRHYWNAGIFCFQISTILAEMEKHCPDILTAVQQTLANSTRHESGNRCRIDLNADAFSKTPDSSVDYAVMEKSDKIAAVFTNFGWSDIGSWNALGDLVEADHNGNRVSGDVLLHEVGNCYVYSQDRIAGLVGVKDLIVIDTADALLVADKSRAQDVKHIYAQLKSQGHEAHKTHRTVHRPWGAYTVLEEGPGFKIKRILVKPGASLSLQMHRHRSEHWVVVNGTARVFLEDGTFLLPQNESTFIPAGRKHRLENPGQDDLIVIEVQSGAYLGEDDITRFDDKYGRA